MCVKLQSKMQYLWGSILGQPLNRLLQCFPSSVQCSSARVKFWFGSTVFNNMVFVLWFLYLFVFVFVFAFVLVFTVQQRRSKVFEWDSGVLSWPPVTLSSILTANLLHRKRRFLYISKPAAVKRDPVKVKATCIYHSQVTCLLAVYSWQHLRNETCFYLELTGRKSFTKKCSHLLYYF